MRKRDPGEFFPWERLWRGGVGHWRPPATLSGGALFAHEEEGPSVRALQAMLALYGYGLELSGVYDHRRTRAVLTAFQRHFRPARVDGEADASTVATLKALIEGLIPVLEALSRCDAASAKGQRLRGLCDRVPPRGHRRGAKRTVGLGRDEMALYVEGVVDGGVG